MEFKAHKFVLMTCSWEFYNVFHLLYLDSDELLVDDVSSWSFCYFLTYCYTGDVELNQLNAGNAVDILKLAYRYGMEHLIEIAEAYLPTILSNDNIFQLLQASLCLPEHSKLQQNILRKVGENFTNLLKIKLSEFVNLPYSALHLIAESEHLKCTESELFHATMKWATKSCAKIGVPPTSMNLRRNLRDAFFKIRFPAMSSNDFMECLAKYPGMFTVNEIADISSVIRKYRECCQVFNFQWFWRDAIAEGVPSVSSEKLILPGVPDAEFVSCYGHKLQEITEATTCKTEFRFFMYNELFSFEGFAFFVKRSDTFNVQSCSLSIYQYNQWLKKDVTVTVQARHQIECSVVGPVDIVILKVEFINLSSNRGWYHFTCSYDVGITPSYGLDLNLTNSKPAHFKIPTINGRNFIFLENCRNVSYLIVKHQNKYKKLKTGA